MHLLNRLNNLNSTENSFSNILQQSILYKGFLSFIHKTFCVKKLQKPGAPNNINNKLNSNTIYSNNIHYLKMKTKLINNTIQHITQLKINNWKLKQNTKRKITFVTKEKLYLFECTCMYLFYFTRTIAFVFFILRPLHHC